MASVPVTVAKTAAMRSPPQSVATHLTSGAGGFTGGGGVTGDAETTNGYSVLKGASIQLARLIGGLA